MKYEIPDSIIPFYNKLSVKDRQEWLFERMACLKSLFYLVKVMGGRKFGGDSSPYIHKPLCDFWQDDDIPRKAIAMPRGWQKSTVFTMWGNIHRYLRNNEVRILIPSQKVGLSSDFVSTIGKQIRYNERLRWTFPELQVVDDAYVKNNTYSKEEVELPRKNIGMYPEPTFRAIGITGGAQGGHYNFINPDDLISEKGMESPSIMQDAMRWFDNIEELLDEQDTRRESHSVVSVVGTHWGLGDIFGYIQEKYKNYQWRIVPCLKDLTIEKPKHIVYVNNPNVEQGECNFPERYSTEHYNEKKHNPEKQLIFWSQDMNNPQDSDLNKFSPRWIKYYRFEERDKGLYVVCQEPTADGKMLDGKSYSVEEMPKWGIIDPGGFSETKVLTKGSRNAITIFGQPRNALEKFVLYAWCGRLKEPSKFVEEVFKANDLFTPKLWKIETVAAQEYIKRDIDERKKKKHIRMILSSCPPDNTEAAKDARIQSLIPPMAAGEIYIHPNMEELEDEITHYPQSITKDLVDCMGWCNILFWTRRDRKELQRIRESQSWDDVDSRDSVTGY